MIEARQSLQQGRPVQAERLCREIVSAFPDYPDAHNFLSVALGRQGRAGEAERASRRALELRPDDPGALWNLGNRLVEQGQVGPAIDSWRAALARSPQDPLLIRRLAAALAEQGRLDEAAAVADTLVQCLAPVDPEVEMACGRILAAAGRPAAALPLFERALTGGPERVDWRLDYARLTFGLERFDLAQPALEQVLARQPAQAEARTMLASILLRRREFARMEEVLRGLTAAGADAANATTLTGLMLAAQGKLEEGLAALALVEQIAPDAHELQMTRVMYLNYDAEIGREALFQAHRAFGRRFGGLVPALPAPGNDRDPERRLRIGLISPDLRAHSVAYFAAPFLQAFDRERFEVVAYAHVQRPDPVTAQLQALASSWRDVSRLDLAGLAAQIRADGIDIAIDLAGLTANSRLLALTGRPAPVQMSYLGYPNTTGLAEVDYRITDPIADPDDADGLHTETLIRLPRCFLCYAVPEHAPAIGTPPSDANGCVTFGSFNSTNKINRPLIALWSEVLQAVPGSRLLLKSPASGDPVAQSTLRSRFAEAGLDPARIEFAPYAGSLSEHLDQYNRVDIALDTFPYNGATTTCEALWMGVPVITLVGDRHAARVGASLLHSIGFEAGITHGAEEFVQTARLLALHPELLRTARCGLRHDLLRSPLCDMHGHARSLEEAFRQAWRIWCAGAAS